MSVEEFSSSTTVAEEASRPDDDDMIGQHRHINTDEDTVEDVEYGLPEDDEVNEDEE